MTDPRQARLEQQAHHAGLQGKAPAMPENFRYMRAYRRALRYVSTDRAQLRAAAARLPHDHLEHAARNEQYPQSHRAAARREIKRRRKAERRWLADFLRRGAEDSQAQHA